MSHTGLWAKSCPGQPLFIPLRMALSSKCSRWEVSTWEGDTGHSGPGASRARSPAPQLWPQDAKAFFFPTGNKVWFQKDTRKGIQDFTGMTMSKKREHVRYLTCTLGRHKCQHSKAPTWSSSHFLLAVRAETEAAPMTKLLKPLPIFIPTATVEDVLLLPTHGWGD